MSEIAGSAYIVNILENKELLFLTQRSNISKIINFLLREGYLYNNSDISVSPTNRKLVLNDDGVIDSKQTNSGITVIDVHNFNIDEIEWEIIPLKNIERCKINKDPNIIKLYTYILDNRKLFNPLVIGNFRYWIEDLHILRK